MPTPSQSIVPGENNAPSRQSRSPTIEIMLTASQGSALRRYVSAVETLTTATKPGTRLGASDDLKHANLTITPQQRAIINWIVNGNEIPDLAAKTGRATSELKEMLIAGLDRLVAHYAQVEL